ncbi:hypothetical protein HK405_015396, partial [Cladochytrium tenue]
PAAAAANTVRRLQLLLDRLRARVSAAVAHAAPESLRRRPMLALLAATACAFLSFRLAVLLARAVATGAWPHLFRRSETGADDSGVKLLLDRRQRQPGGLPAAPLPKQRQQQPAAGTTRSRPVAIPGAVTAPDVDRQRRPAVGRPTPASPPRVASSTLFAIPRHVKGLLLTISVKNVLMWNPSPDPAHPNFAFTESAIPYLHALVSSPRYVVHLVAVVSSDREQAQIRGLLARSGLLGGSAANGGGGGAGLDSRRVLFCDTETGKAVVVRHIAPHTHVDADAAAAAAVAPHVKRVVLVVRPAAAATAAAAAAAAPPPRRPGSPEAPSLASASNSSIASAASSMAAGAAIVPASLPNPLAGSRPAGGGGSLHRRTSSVASLTLLAQQQQSSYPLPLDAAAHSLTASTPSSITLSSSTNSALDRFTNVITVPSLLESGLLL